MWKTIVFTIIYNNVSEIYSSVQFVQYIRWFIRFCHVYILIVTLHILVYLEFIVNKEKRSAMEIFSAITFSK